MDGGIISTVPDLCKRCYSCIRECPAKAIRVINGQALVIQERCIACGHCVKVCSQHAKTVHSDIDFVMEELLSVGKVIAVVAPSFAASFPDNYKKLPTAIRKIGFASVVETAFGADLISQQYRDEIEKNDGTPIIASSCPAVTNFIQKYYSELLPNLAKVVSPMIALGRYLRANEAEPVKIVFIGPCIAKKDEILDPEVEGIIDAALTFTELKTILKKMKIDPDTCEESYFDPPHAMLGKAYPLAGGLLKSSGIDVDVLNFEVMAVEGKNKVVEVIEELANNKINARFVDVLFCEGCISGPAIDSNLNYYSRREKVIEFIKRAINYADRQVWKSTIYNSRDLDFSRNFSKRSERLPMPSEEKIKEILAETGKYSSGQELNCGACGYSSCREFAIAMGKGLGEKEMCLPYLIERLQSAYESLRTTQEQLHSAEKLASIGQLAAGVAHEINNPLGTIMLYASLIKRGVTKLTAEGTPLTGDLDLIVQEANRCKSIVQNLLNFARQGKLHISEFDLPALLNHILKKMKVDPKNEGVSYDIRYADPDITMEGDKEQIEQVLTNVIGNAIEAMENAVKKELSVRVEKTGSIVKVKVGDTGSGILKENFGKVFTPFFTTKKMGKGTGLGLAIAYGIVKMHKGEIRFVSEINKGTEFTISLPAKFES